MKLLKNRFDNYTNSYINIHNIKELESIDSISDLKNLIFFGKEGIGKYTESLNLIKKFSPSQLKYEKKIAINLNKNDIFIKISDIHYEIDFELLGYNSKSLLNEIYNLIIEIICSKQKKEGIILCKNFELIDYELVDIFYSYMKKDINKIYKLKFILLTTNYSFLPNSIINICKIISLKVPAKYNIKKIKNKKYKENKIGNNFEIESHKNNENNELIKYNENNELIKYNENIENNENNENIENNENNENKEFIKNNEKSVNNFKDLIFLKNFKYNKYQLLNIYEKIINNNIDFNELRNELYDLLIYRVNINIFIWELLEILIINEKIKNEKIDNCLDKTFNFFLQYNNNYRPIFHLENYILYLIKIINEY